MIAIMIAAELITPIVNGMIQVRLPPAPGSFACEVSVGLNSSAVKSLLKAASVTLRGETTEGGDGAIEFVSTLGAAIASWASGGRGGKG